MKLSDFASWFQIFTALNIAYAGSDDFRSYITKISEKSKDLASLIYSTYESFYEFLLSRINSRTQAFPSNKKYKKKLEKFYNNFHSQEKLVNWNSILERDFTQQFKSVFFVCSIFGLSYLFLCGYKDELDIDFFHKFLFTSNALCFSYGIIVFAISLFKNKIDKPLNLFLNIAIILFLYVIVFFVRNHIQIDSQEHKNINILFSVFSVVLPFFLFFIRIIFQLIFSVLFLVIIILSGCIKLAFVNLAVFFHSRFESFFE